MNCSKCGQHANCIIVGEHAGAKYQFTYSIPIGYWSYSGSPKAIYIDDEKETKQAHILLSGHNHEDNREDMLLECSNGHRESCWVVSTCPHPECSWESTPHESLRNVRMKNDPWDHKDIPYILNGDIIMRK